MQLDIYNIGQLYNQRVIVQNPKLEVYYRNYHIAPYKLETEEDIYKELYKNIAAIRVFVEQDYDEIVFYKTGEQGHLLDLIFSAKFKERLPKELMSLYTQCKKEAGCGDIVEVFYLPEESKQSLIQTFLQEALDYKPTKEKQDGKRLNVE